MKMYILSLGAGLLVGIIYSLLNVRSPAPPLIALLGLLGMLVGEQIIPVGKQLLSGTAFPQPVPKRIPSATSSDSSLVARLRKDQSSEEKRS